MTRPFDITNTNDALTLDTSGRGKVVFTVTNTSQKALRGTLRVRGLDTSQPGWFTVGGDSERDFPPGVAHQVEVDVQAPAGTPQGKFRMRLDALSVVNPDDDFTEGPTVALTMPAAEVVVPKPGMPWWVWVVIAVVLMVVIGVVWALMSRKPATRPMPRVVGQTFDGAKSQLEAAGLTVTRVEQPTSDDCGGTVISTSPAAEQSVAAGTSVTVNVGVLSSGPATCRSGFVWREAFQGDTVCVAPQTRAQAAQDNQAAQSRRSPTGGAYGPDTCLQGFVWRDARQGDHVCVPGAVRQAAAADNAQAAARRACRR